MGKKAELFIKGKIHFTIEVPKRTGEDETDAPPIVTVKKLHESPGPRMSHSEMLKYLVEQHSMKCQGCDRLFDDERYLELDHNTPRSDDSMNHIRNCVLLCGPC